jgi:hypothetical protein
MFNNENDIDNKSKSSEEGDVVEELLYTTDYLEWKNLMKWPELWKAQQKDERIKYSTECYEKHVRGNTTESNKITDKNTLLLN